MPPPNWILTSAAKLVVPLAANPEALHRSQEAVCIVRPGAQARLLEDLGYVPGGVVASRRQRLPRRARVRQSSSPNRPSSSHLQDGPRPPCTYCKLANEVKEPVRQQHDCKGSRPVPARVFLPPQGAWESTTYPLLVTARRPLVSEVRMLVIRSDSSSGLARRGSLLTAQGASLGAGSSMRRGMMCQ